MKMIYQISAGVELVLSAVTKYFMICLSSLQSQFDKIRLSHSRSVTTAQGL